MALYDILLANLTRLLLDLEWLAAFLARSSGLSDATLSRILSGRQTNLTLETVHRLALAVGVPAARLLSTDSLSGAEDDSGNGDVQNDWEDSRATSSLAQCLRSRYGYAESEAEELAEELDAMCRARDEVRRRRP